jgi:AcrR family transcriptional regulator
VRDRLKRQEQRERTRLSLLAAAETVFAQRGIQSASLDEVAAEAGLTKGAVYSNFASKEDLVLAVMRHRLHQEADTQAGHLTYTSSPAQLVADFGDYWASTMRSGQQDSYHRVVLELLVHALRHPTVREELITLLFPPLDGKRHPLAPPGSTLATLPPQHVDAILKALDIGMELLTTLDPEHCPPELFPIALRLLAGVHIDQSHIPPTEQTPTRA